MRESIQFNSGVEQRPARRPHKPQVVGSNPTPASMSPEAVCRALPILSHSLATGQGGHECACPNAATGSAAPDSFIREVR